MKSKPKDEPKSGDTAWLMVEEYAKKKSIFGCILCEKTHRKEDCEHKARRIAKAWYEEEKVQYTYYGD